MSNATPAIPDNLPTNGLDTVLYHSAYLTTPNAWEGVRRRLKETEKLTTTRVKICNKLCSASVHYGFNTRYHVTIPEFFFS